MSDTDSFIEEVTEEVRRDRLFATFRRYGWIAVLAVLLIVGGTAFNEWRKAQARAQAQAFGDAMMAALEADTTEARLTALDALNPQTPGAQAVLGFARAAELIEAGRTADAVAALNAVATRGELAAIYRQMAGFQALTLQPDLPAADRRAQFEALGQSGGVLRLLTEEQIALIEVETGDRDAALERLSRLIADAEVTQGLQRRAAQLIVSLGGTLPQTAPTE